MGTKTILTVISEAVSADGRLTRREMVRRLMAGAAAGAAWPLMAVSHPIHELLRNDAVLVEAEKLGAADWKPLFLSAQQIESLPAIEERIVPESAKAQMHHFSHLLLSLYPANHTTKL